MWEFFGSHKPINPSARWLAFAASALIVGLTLWAAGLDLELRGRFLEEHSATAPKRTRRNAVPAHPAVPPRASNYSNSPLPGAASSISATPQELVLTGVTLGSNVKEGYAMLGVARENPQTYGVGSLLANGTRLTEIHPDYVILTGNGRSTRLYLQGKDSTPRMAKSPESLIAVGGTDATRPVVANTQEPLTDYLRPTPVYDGSAQTGYQVYPGTSAADFAAMGLQAGDVIREIDGEPLTEAVRGINALRKLMDGATHSASVVRNGVVQEVSLDGSHLLKDPKTDNE